MKLKEAVLEINPEKNHEGEKYCDRRKDLLMIHLLFLLNKFFIDIN